MFTNWSDSFPCYFVVGGSDSNLFESTFEPSKSFGTMLALYRTLESWMVDGWYGGVLYSNKH
jgi:hypothetical protein